MRTNALRTHQCVIVELLQAIAVSSPSLASSVMNAIPGTRGATELISNLVKVFSFSDNASVVGLL